MVNMIGVPAIFFVLNWPWKNKVLIINQPKYILSSCARLQLKNLVSFFQQILQMFGLQQQYSTTNAQGATSEDLLRAIYYEYVWNLYRATVFDFITCPMWKLIITSQYASSGNDSLHVGSHELLCKIHLSHVNFRAVSQTLLENFMIKARSQHVDDV